MADRIDRTRITADASQFNAEMEAAADKYLSESQRIASAMREAMQSVGQQSGEAAKKSKDDASLIGQAWSEVKGKIVAAIAGAVSVGAMNAAIGKTKEHAEESRKLAEALGISRTEASELTVALSGIYASNDQLLTANKAVTRTLVENEQAFRSLGVATRDTATGGFRNSLDIIVETNQKLMEFAEGTDRNIEGQKVYKKSWEEVRPVLRLTTDLMVESRARAAELGLTLGKENVDAVERFKAAQNDAQDVSLAMAKVVGDAVMPVLTDLMNEMGESGPRKVSALREAMGHVVVVFYAAKTAIFAVWETIKGLFQTIGITVGTMAEVAAALVTRDWRRALNAIGTQYTALRDVATDTFESIATEAEKNSQKAADALERALTPATGTRTQRQGGAGSTGGDDKASVQRWEAELAAQRNAYEQAKLLEGSFQQFSKQQEADFWQAKILLTAEGSKSRAEVEKKYYDAKREVRKLDFDADMESLKVRIDEEKKINTARIDMAAQAYQAMVKAHGAGSAQAIAALARLQQVTREYFDELKHLEDTRAERERAYQASRVELERANLETLYQLGQVTAEQKLVALKTLKEREYEIDLEAENIKSKNLEEGTLEYEQHLSRLAQLKQKHAVDMAQIDGQIKVESFRVWRDIGDAITSAISTSLRGVMQGTQTISQAIRNMAQSVLLALVDMGVKWIAQQVINAAIGKAIDKASSAGKIADAAAVGAANTFSSISAIPIVGPFLAPGAAAAAYAEGMAWQGALAVAAKGFDVPAGVNPVTQLHAEEMVLPAHLANTVRDLAANAGGGGAPRSATIKAAPLPRGFWVMHSSEIAKALGIAERNFEYTRG